ncbi:MAG TPA: hypothetical protein VKE22_19985 [Haliangiales bacterium]|nr:hypothetical protein [Haliangiales bacterium]
MKKTVVTCILLGGLASALALGAVSCGGGGGTTSDGGTVDAPSVAGTYTHYVMNHVTLGTAATAKNYGFDLNGDGINDNVLGGALALAANFGLSVEDVVNGVIARGGAVLLHSLKATSLTTSAAATWQVYLGTPFTDAQTDAGMFPDFSGHGTFMIAGNSPTNAIVSGAVAGGAFSTTTPGLISIQLPIAGPPVQIDLQSARIQVTVTADGCMGKLGGGILLTDLETKIYPQVAAALDAQIKANGCTTATKCNPRMDPCTTTQCAIASLADTNHDGTITATDLQTGTVGGIIMADVDLVPGVPNPHDASNPKESVSFGLGFECVKATFTAANEH